MDKALWFIFPFYLIIVLLWVWAAAWIRGFRSNEAMHLAPEPGAPTDPRSSALAVFVAAHNEEGRIAACLERLLGQNYGNLRVIVVNDRSDDRTSECVRHVMAKDPRVSLVEVNRLPHGWIGKTHALARAAAGVEAEYFLFVDCDCRLVPGSIAAVMRKVTSERLEFVSLWPRLDLRSLSERLLTPAVSWLLGLWTILGSKSAQDGSQVVLGNGQFMLFSRRAYEQIGGHAGVQAELAEDIIMARKVERLGLKHWVGWGKGLYLSTRDNTFASTMNATTRVVLGSLVTGWRVHASGHLLLGGVTSVVYFGLASAGLALAWQPAWGSATPAHLMATLAAAHVLAMDYVIRRVFRMTFERTPSVAMFVAGAAVSVFIVARAWRVGSGAGHVRWGNTRYRVRGSQITDVLPEAGGQVAVR